MSYPFTTFPLVNRVGVTNAYANVDARYGPWNTLNDALTSFNAGLRHEGLTLGIYDNAKIVEYWYQGGIADSNLIIKTPDINISGYLPLSGGTITGNLSVGNILSAYYIRNLNEIILDSNNIIFKTPYPWLETNISHQSSSAVLLKSGKGNNLGSIYLSSLKVDAEGVIAGQKSIKIENIFAPEYYEPLGDFVLQDNFISTTNVELGGTSWTRIFQSNANANLTIQANVNEIRPSTNAAFQGVIYQANSNLYNSSNYEVKVFCREVPPDVTNFNVFWLFARIQDVNNFYAVRFGVKSQDCAIFKRVNGVFSLLRNFDSLYNSYRTNFEVSLRVFENKISVFVDNVLVASVQDSSISTSGRGGIGVGNIGVRGNDSIDTRSRFSNFRIRQYSNFEKDSYIDQNRFGVGTKTPNEKLTVSGNISSNGLIYALGGNSQQWNSNFATVCSLSAQWNQSSNIIPTVTNYLSTNNVLVSSISVLSGTNSFQWTETYSVVSTNSATTWNYQGTDVKNLTAKYERVFSTVQQNSATNWDESAEIIPTVTNYLSTNQVQVSSLIAQDGIYNSGYFWDQYQAPNNNNWSSITYGKGLFVAIANSNVVTNNRIMTSNDGIVWTQRTVPVENNWVSVTYGNGLFVAVADDGTNNQRILRSTDGIVWTAISVAQNAWKQVIYGDGCFVAVATSGSGSRIIRSIDGIVWTPIDINAYNSIAYGNGVFVAVAANIIRRSSNNGISFDILTLTSGYNWESVCYANGEFILLSSNGEIATIKANSLPQSITVVGGINSNFLNGSLYYANGLYFIVSRNTGVWVSTDAKNWTRTKSNLTGNSFRTMCYGNGVFVLLANNFINNNNIFVSGKQKITNDFWLSPMYGGLTLYGNLTANNLIIASSGNSDLWTEVYSRVAANSSTWNAAGTPNINLSSIFATVCSLSTNWSSVYNTTCALSTNWSSVYSYWNPLTANTSNVVSFVNTNSGNISLVLAKTTTTSANWDSAYSQLCSLSSNWNLPYDSTLNITSTNAVQNSAIAVKIQSIENGLNILVPAPTYISPQATLTIFSAPAQTYEVGSSVNQNITLGYTQNDAGSATNFRLERNNFFIAQQSTPFSFNVSEIVVLGTTTYKNTVTYVDGPTKNNILSLPDNRGRILAGTVFLNRNYIGRYIQFYGSVPSVPVNLRTLPLSSFDNVNTFSIQANQNNTVLAIPNTKTLSLARTENFQNVTNDFVMTNLSVNDGNGVPVSYKRYVLTTSVPFNVRIDFTLV